MIVIISDDSRGNWGQMLEAAMYPTEREIVRFAANLLNVKPCAACGSCSGKTYGRCVIQDDMQQLLAKIAGCRVLVLVSPVVFGGVSHHIKKVMDRMSAVGNPCYQISGGELVKGMRGQGMNYYMLGVGKELSAAEQSAFLLLHEENRHIMKTEGQVFLLTSGSPEAILANIAKEIVYA